MPVTIGGRVGGDDALPSVPVLSPHIAWGMVRRGEPLAYARRVLANARIDTWRTRRREVLTAPESMPERGACRFRSTPSAMRWSGPCIAFR